MNKKKLKKIQLALKEMLKSPQGRRSSELEGLARQLGREKDARGKEPTYVRKLNPALSPPLSIPNHSGEMKTNTTRSIIEALLDDAAEWDLYLSEGQDDEDDEDDEDNGSDKRGS